MLTVIIPYFKISNFEETLKSLANQTDQRFDVFIGDDASPESPEELLRKYEGAFNFSYLRFNDNLGAHSLTKQWERCLENVQEEWFMILGDDDYLSENAVEEFYKSIQTSSEPVCSVLRFSRQIIGREKVINNKGYTLPNVFKSTEYLYKRSRNEVGSSLSEYVFRIEDYKKYGIKNYPSAFYSDNMMVMEYSGFSNIKNIRATAFIRITNESLSGNSKNKKLIEKAGWLFYSDIIFHYSQFFTVNQLSMFLNIIMHGVLQKQIDLSHVQYIKLCVEKIGWFRTVRKLITLYRL